MSLEKKKKADQGQALENFVLGVGRFIRFVLRISAHGLKRKVIRNPDVLLGLLVTYGFIGVLIFWNWKYLEILSWIFPKIFTHGVLRFLVFHVTQTAQFLFISGALTVLIGIACGILHFFKMVGYQNDLNEIGLKSATGIKPRVIDVEESGEFKKKILVASRGIGLEQYKSRKSDLESAFGAIVDEICISKRSRKLVEINLVTKELPSLVAYSECLNALKEPYSFLVGESLSGIVAQSIRSLPHLLIAGTSGNGKSVFFNQSLISLLKTSPHVQFYLLDLKLGVEVKAYANLPNVRIARDEAEAVQLLKAVVKEMKQRFVQLEKNGNKLIDPEKDKKDLILVGVDEASVLYGKSRGGRKGGSLTATARELTDEIAKLGRAACVHMIVATQKVTNESIDTKIQENIGGRICFRVNTLQGSNTVLGNKRAYELPDVKGRAIWANGNEFTEVQTPFVSESRIKEEIKAIHSEFENGKRKCLGPMLTPIAGTEVDSEATQLLGVKDV